MGGVKIAVALAGGWRGGWFASAQPGSGVWSAGEILAGSSGSNAETPAGAIIPSWRLSEVSIPHSLPCAGVNPRTRPGISIINVAFLLGGAAWCMVDGSLGLWWFDSGGRSSGGSSALCQAAVVDICLSFFVLSLFFWA
jgi:hypothetical protein